MMNYKFMAHFSQILYSKLSDNGWGQEGRNTVGKSKENEENIKGNYIG